MGCTSSATNMAPKANATDKLITINKEDAEQMIKEVVDVNHPSEDSGRNEIKVLPSCDTLAEPIKLDSYNKSLIEQSNLDLDKDLPKNEIVDSENTIQDRESPHIEEKLSSLEDVVEKVVELYVADNVLLSKHDEPKEKEKNVTTKENETKKCEEKVEELETQTVDKESETNEQEEEVSDETLSPSQSTSSRATRWEALADIAAELPPSLAVDPLTGQIYSLSK